jgi:hypothetical protein
MMVAQLGVFPIKTESLLFQVGILKLNKIIFSDRLFVEK